MERTETRTRVLRGNNWESVLTRDSRVGGVTWAAPSRRVSSRTVRKPLGGQMSVQGRCC